jgi:hypothetical protein
MAATVLPINFEEVKAKRLAARLRRAVERRIAIHEEAKSAEAEVKGYKDDEGLEHPGLNDVIVECFAEQGCDGVRFGDLGYTVSLVAVVGRETLDRDALMAGLLQHVSPTVAAELFRAATKKGAARSEVRLMPLRPR